ncbi:homoserine dehydrogenase family protein [Formosa maritima]|uniref:homoserine dehydrogenase n=1 Tax=Formosa maritima TaxID=2592046 RepID=A0A5D0GJQ0_9FLAO|nr:aspartate kinase [Formosa maritima]TYA58007.1 aspartate kinase [Formosa maritima]
MSNSKTLHVVIFGIGNVGSTLINQIQAAKTQLQLQQQLNIQIPVVTNSKLAFYNEFGLANSWQCDFENASIPYKIEDILAFVKKHHFQNLVAIDATACKNFVQNYIPLIENGFHIVSANKVANTLSFEFYEQLRLTLKKHQKSFLYETNVGAGLPVIETIKRLYDSGEQIQRIRGVFSGSLSYIFNEFSSESVSFSDILKQASHLGLTEPDAREDLSGNDVARKLLILARELRIKTELHDVLVESLVPKKLNGKTTVHQFKSRSKELDLPFQKRKQNLLENQVLRYVGELDVVNKKLEVKLISEEKNSAIGQLKGADSVFEIYSESYQEFPLVIQGAGAGKSVTARGLFSDIVKLSNSLN